MKPFVRTGIALAAASGLGAYIYFVELKKPSAEDEKKKEKVFALDKAKATRVELRPAGGEAVVVEKDGAAWKLVAPAPAPADASEVDSLLGTLQDLEVDEVVVEAPAELGQFGLDPSRKLVRVAQEGAAAPLELLIGEKSPDGSSLYAKTAGAPRVFTIASWRESSFDKKPFDLRDRDLLKVKRDAVKRLEVAGKDEGYALERDDKGDWAFSRPLRTLAGRWSVDGLLGTLESLRMESVADEQAKDLRKYGLDKPARTVKLTLADGGYKILEIGGPAGEKKYHAREASSPLVAVIPSAIVDDLAKGMKELRAKRVADVATFDVEGVELAGGNARTLARATSKDAAGVEQQSWKKTAPEAKDLERSKVEDALFKLTGLEVQEFLDKPQAASAYGLDAPVAKVTLKLSGGKPAVTLEFARKDGAYYSRRPGDDAVLKLDAAKVEEALKALAEL